MMEDPLSLSVCSPSTQSPQSRSLCRLVPLLSTPSATSDFVQKPRLASEALASSILQGVVAYVDVRTESDNRSRAVGLELEHLGATVVDRFTDDVTHFVYKDGKKRSLDMALRRKVQLVSVLWVESCKQNQRKVSEDEFRVILPKKQTPVGPSRLKRYRSMQPKSFAEELILSEEKLRRKQRRKEKTPESSRWMDFFVANTCCRSPNVDGLACLGDACIPDTPPSAQKHLVKGKAKITGHSTPEVFSFSSGSLKLNLSCGDDSNEATENSRLKGRQRTIVNGADDFAQTFLSTLGEKLTESVSPEIELLKPQVFSKRRYLDSSSSYDSEKAPLLLAKPRLGMPNITRAKSSLVENGLKTPSEHRNGAEKSTSGTKRKSSPCVDEVSKRFRIGGEAKNSMVSFIPLSQLNSTESGTMSKMMKKKRKESSAVESDAGCETTIDTSGYSLPKNRQNSVAMDTSGYSISEDRQRIVVRKITADVRHKGGTDDDLDSSGYSVPKDAGKNMRNIECSVSIEAHVTRSSPTSSQEASFVGSNGRGFVLNDINKGLQAKCVTFSEVVEGKQMDNTKTNIKSHATVPLQRLPDAWNQSKSRNGSLRSNPVAQQSGCSENFQNGGQSRLKEDSENVSDSVDDGILTLGPKKRKTSGERTGKQIVKMASTKAKASSVDSAVKTLTPVMVTTSLHRGDQKMVNRAICELGRCTLAEQVDDSTTHVVSGENRRTVKVLTGISRGLWILSLDWVKDSVSKGRWLPETPYELTDEFPAAELSRTERERSGLRYKQDLFSAVGEIFVASGSSPPKTDLEDLITLCSGKITKQIRNAKICVGKFLRQSVVNVNEKWILDSITLHQCLPTDEYILIA